MLGASNQRWVNYESSLYYTGWYKNLIRIIGFYISICGLGKCIRIALYNDESVSKVCRLSCKGNAFFYKFIFTVV